MSRIEPVAISAITLASALGHGLAPTLDA